MQAIADPSRCDEVKKSQAKDIASFDEEINEYAALVKDNPATDAKVKEMMGSWNKFKTSLPAVIDAVKAGGSEAGTAEYNCAGKDDTTKLRDQLKALTKDAVEEAAAVNAANQEASASSTRTMILSIVACFVLLLFVSLYIIKVIKAPLTEMIETCNRPKSGNFVIQGQAFSRGDEFGDVERALFEMSKSVNSFLIEVAKSAEQIASASEELMPAPCSLLMQLYL